MSNVKWTLSITLNNGKVLVYDNLDKERLDEYRKTIWIVGVKNAIIPNEKYEWISPLRICEVIATKMK